MAELIFGIFGKVWKKNPSETVPEVATRQGARLPPGRAPDPRGPPIRRLIPFFRREKANFWIEIVSKFQPNRSYGSPGI